MVGNFCIAQNMVGNYGGEFGKTMSNTTFVEIMVRNLSWGILVWRELLWGILEFPTIYGGDFILSTKTLHWL